jgi:hypothetical protein
MQKLATTHLSVSSYTGRPRIVCDVCGKAAHPTQESAEASARRIEERGQRMNAYLGEACGWWHLTRSRER